MEADPTTPMGELIFKIFAMIAEFERQQIVERTKSSIRSSMRNDKKINGGPVVLGFDKDPNNKGRWIPNKDEITKIEYLMEHFCKSLSYISTVKEAKEKGITTKSGKNFKSDSMKRLLSNRKYVGEMKIPCDDPKWGG